MRLINDRKSVVIGQSCGEEEEKKTKKKTNTDGEDEDEEEKITGRILRRTYALCWRKNIFRSSSTFTRRSGANLLYHAVCTEKFCRMSLKIFQSVSQSVSHYFIPSISKSFVHQFLAHNSVAVAHAFARCTKRYTRRKVL